MDELEHAIAVAGGVGKLAAELGVRQSVVSNWRQRRSVPRGWLVVLVDRYKSRTQPQEAVQAAAVQASE